MVKRTANGRNQEGRLVMGIYKELDITYQQIVDREADRLIAGIKEQPLFTPINERVGAEPEIWREIGSVDYNLADELVSEYPYEAALVCIERGQIPADNPEWQRLVVSLAYNALTDFEEFESLIEHSRFSVSDVQAMLDLAAGAVLQHPNFQLTGFQHISPK
jgi:hypothetical protein